MHQQNSDFVKKNYRGMNLSKYRIILIVLIVSMLLVVCNSGCSEDSDNTTITEEVLQENDVDTNSENISTRGEDESMNDLSENTDIMESVGLKNGAGSEETTEISLEGSTSEAEQDCLKDSGENTTKPNSSPTGSTKPSGSTNVKTSEASSKVQTTTKAQVVTTKAAQSTTAAPKPTQSPVQPTTAAPKPTQPPVQPTTAASKPTEAPTQASTQAPKPTEAPKSAYNPDYVIAETTRQLKAAGYIHIPEHLDNELAQGLITKEHYDSIYPTAGCGWFETTLYNVTFGLTIEDDVYEMVEGCKYLCKDYFYIEYVGENEYGGYTFRVYR